MKTTISGVPLKHEWIKSYMPDSTTVCIILNALTNHILEDKYRSYCYLLTCVLAFITSLPFEDSFHCEKIYILHVYAVSCVLLGYPLLPHGKGTYYLEGYLGFGYFWIFKYVTCEGSSMLPLQLFFK